MKSIFMFNGFVRPKKMVAAIVIFVCTPVPALSAEDYFNKDVYVTLRESNQVLHYPGKTVWPGGPKMLYNDLTPDGKTLVVSSPKDGAVYLFDAASGAKLTSIKCGKASKGLKISPDGKEVYVANEAGNSVSVVDLLSRKVVATIPTDEMPHNVRFRGDGKIAYVTLQGGAGLAVIDTKQRKIIKVIPTPGIETPHNLDLSKDESHVYIRDVANQVGVLELATGKMQTRIEVGNGHAGIDVLPNGKYIATGAIADDYVTIIDASNQRIVKKVKVGFGPHGVRASKDSRWLYVSVTADDKVVVIDMKTMTVVHADSIGSFPFWVAVNGNP